MLPVQIAAALLAVAAGAGLPSDNQAPAPKPDRDGFYSLFNGRDLEGWKASENPATFKVEDGVLVVHGPRAHLYYVGPVRNHDFRDFHLRVEVQTFPRANSGIYFHTEYQEEGWPRKGFECQVNQTHGDVRKTGGLYGVKDVLNESPVKDNEWYTYDIVVKGQTVTIKVNGKTTAEWTQPADWQPPAGMPGRRLSSGTFAIQGHDPGSRVLYRSIKVKPLE